MSTEADLGALLERLSAVEQRIGALVQQRRAVDPQPDDPYRGLYVSDEQVDHLLSGARAADRAGPLGLVARPGSALAALRTSCGLDEVDLDLLVIALAPELDPRFEPLLGYLNDDVTRRRAGAAVAFELCGLSLASGADRARITRGPLVASGLVELTDTDRPLASRGLQVPDRVVAHLLGDDTPHPQVAHLIEDVPPISWGDPAPLVRALAAGEHLVYLREDATSSGRLLAAQALAAGGRGVVSAVLPGGMPAAEVAAAVGLLVREARLRGAGLVLGPVGELVAQPGLVDSLGGDLPVFLVGTDSWDPAWSRRIPLRWQVPASTVAEREALWAAELAAAGAGTPAAAGEQGTAGQAATAGSAGSSPSAAPPTSSSASAQAALTSQFRLRPEQVYRAARTARAQAAADGTAVGAEHVRAGARAENGTALERLARRISPAVTWADLVLPGGIVTGLREIALRARHRERVLGDWRMRPGGGRGHGVAALFAGDSGTGKTMSAEVLAADLGLDLYVVDLATVVDKYIGETEKNLERIFTAAQGVNAVLLFDEADSIFGKRSEVKDAHDRYANIESAYLLQRLESFDGLVLLATNLRANIDEAFTRRLDVVVDFPLPDAEHRRLLWDRCLGTALPRAGDLDLDFCAEAFTLSGGAIRSAAISAAYFAAEDDGPLRMDHLVTAVQREYRKLGRLTLAEEFGDYWPLLHR